MWLAEYKKVPATDKAEEFLAGNWCLFPTMMIDRFNFPTHGCSASEPATDGNNAPFPLKACCSLCGALLLTNNPHYENTFPTVGVEILMRQTASPKLDRGGLYKKRILFIPESHITYLNKAQQAFYLQRILYNALPSHISNPGSSNNVKMQI